MSNLGIQISTKSTSMLLVHMSGMLRVVLVFVRFLRSFAVSFPLSRRPIVKRFPMNMLLLGLPDPCSCIQKNI